MILKQVSLKLYLSTEKDWKFNKIKRSKIIRFYPSQSEMDEDERRENNKL